jgi:transcriptional regulator with XRE-family HTH domain
MKEKNLKTTPMIERLGSEIRRLRLGAGLTIEELSGKAGVSVGLISSLERGNANPSFATLYRIATGLGVQIGSFFLGPMVKNRTVMVVREDERKRLTLSHESPLYELLTPDLRRRMEVVWVEFAPGLCTRDYPYQHEGEECGVMLGGELHINIGGQTYRLGPGDSITYPSSLPHWYHNKGDKKAYGIWVSTPPSW